MCTLGHEEQVSLGYESIVDSAGYTDMSHAQRYLGSEHLLLGLLRVEGSVAHQGLNSLGIIAEDT
jgi:hypothetical protein